MRSEQAKIIAKYQHYAFKNGASEAAPAFAIMQGDGLVSDRDQATIEIRKPTTTSGTFYSNGIVSVAAGKEGSCCVGPMHVVQYDGTVAVDDPVRVKVGTWKVEAGAGFGIVVDIIDASKKLALVKETPSGGIECESGLAPGVYQGIAGGPIGPGESGSVTVDGTAYNATNSSECLVRLGERVFVGVDPDCGVFFTTCKCCGDGGGDGCCDRSIAFCICGEQKTLKVDGGTASWNVAACCCCSSTATFAITMSCSGSGSGHSVSAAWEYSCGATTDSGTLAFDLSTLCSDNEVELTGDLTITGCDIPLPIRVGNFLAETCAAVPCEPPPGIQTDCCENPIPQTLTLTISSGPCAGTRALTYDSGLGEWVADGFPGCAGGFRLQCAEFSPGNFSWELALVSDNLNFDIVSCDPLSLTYTDGTYGTVTITE